MQELPLYVFTLFTQLAAGIVLFVALRATLVKEPPAGGRQGAARPEARALAVAVAAGGVALIASLFHLGDMTKALNVLAGLGRSWLSCEVVMASLFFVLTVIALVCVRRAKAALPSIWIAALLGVALSVVEGIAYAVTAVPAWGALNTVLSFLAAVLAFSATAGPLLMQSDICRADSSSGARRVLIGIAVAALVVLTMALAVEGFVYGGLQSGTGAARIAGEVFARFAALWGAYAIAVFAGVALAVVLGLKLERLVGKGVFPPLLLAAFALVAIGLLAGRAVFYLVGIPMDIGL